MGPNSVAGHAALIMNDYARGCEEVALVPSNGATSKILSGLLNPARGNFVGEVQFWEAERNPDYERLSRHVDCDANGKFHFENVPAGDYYLVAQITWLIRLAHRGGFVIQPISVSGPMTGLEILASR
jgi:hypothetical protein